MCGCNDWSKPYSGNMKSGIDRNKLKAAGQRQPIVCSPAGNNNVVYGVAFRTLAGSGKYHMPSIFFSNPGNGSTLS